MEFEKNKPTTAADIALADAPKVTLQPVHGDIHAEATNMNYSHQGEANFKFESESTDATADTLNRSHPHHRIALIIAIVTAIVFGSCLTALLILK